MGADSHPVVCVAPRGGSISKRRNVRASDEPPLCDCMQQLPYVSYNIDGGGAASLKISQSPLPQRMRHPAPVESLNTTTAKREARQDIRFGPC